MIDINHPDFNLGLDTTFADEQLEKDYLKYALSDRVESKDSETKELSAKLHEENVEASKGQRFVQEDDFAHDRLGAVLDAKEFLRRLNKIVPARYSSATRHGMLGLQVWQPTMRGGEWQFVCGAQGGLVPEFSTMYFNSHNVPTSEKYRGWRTVLIRLILGGFARESEVEKEFGRTDGAEGVHYRKLLFSYRNR